MEEIIKILKTCKKNDALGIQGCIGSDLDLIRDELEGSRFFFGKEIKILETPEWPKTTKFFILNKNHRDLFCDEIFLFALYLIENDIIIINCSIDSINE